ncbi:MAG: hypothetical protein WA152_01790 [Microgenomates group bacterium]
MAFNIFPTPKYLKITKSVKQIEITIPLLELPRINDRKNINNIKKLTKNKNTKKDELGSVK